MIPFVHDDDVHAWGRLAIHGASCRRESCSTERLTQTATTVRYSWNHPANRHRRFRQLSRVLSYQMQARAFYRRMQARVGDRAQVWVDLYRISASKALYADPLTGRRYECGRNVSNQVTSSLISMPTWVPVRYWRPAWERR